LDYGREGEKTINYWKIWRDLGVHEQIFALFQKMPMFTFLEVNDCPRTSL
jgi:hypothetical protein